MISRVLFSSASDDWSTPDQMYQTLHREFTFVDDPCPLYGKRCDVDGLMREWKSPCFVNPPYSEINLWIEKAHLEAKAGKTVVMLVPSRTDTKWWHVHAMNASEIRFIRGRLKFGGRKDPAPFPSALIIFRGAAQ